MKVARKSGIAALCVALILSGCARLSFNDGADIRNRPVSEWSDRDCMTLLLGTVQSNYFDPNLPPVYASVTPYTPTVVLALNRLAQLRNLWTGEHFREKTDALLRETGGLYIDWEHDARLYDAQLHALKNPLQMDSLMFTIKLANRTWPCVPPILITGGGGKLLPPISDWALSDWPCPTPDISALESKIWLINEQGDTAKPIYVWGRRNSLLTTEEILIVQFPLQGDFGHLLYKTKGVNLVIAGLEPDLRFEFPVASLR